MSFYLPIIQAYHLNPGTTIDDNVIVAVHGYDEPLVDDYQYSSTILVHFTRLDSYNSTEIAILGDALQQWVNHNQIITVRGIRFHVQLNVIHDDYHPTVPQAEILRDNIVRLYLLATILRE
jgi:hypothetical protein